MPNSQEVEKRIVELRFENSQFQDATKETMKSLDNLDRALTNTGSSRKNIDAMSKSLSALNSNSLSKLASNVDDISKHFTWFGRTVDHFADMVTNSIANMASSGISNLTALYNKYLGFDPNMQGFAEYEQKMGSIQTILTNTASKGTTLEEVNSALDELNTYADKTIYNFQEMTRNIGTFTAAGIDLADATSAIKGISNLAAGVGSTPQQAATAMYQLSQALAAGTVTLQDWNSVVNAGMGGEYFQNALKETAREIADAKGIAYKTFEGTFRESISGQGGSGWLTSEVLLETLKKFADDPALEEAATKVKTWTQLVDTMGEAVQSGWSQSWEIVVGTLDEASEFFTTISNGFNSIIGPIADNRNAMLKYWKDMGGREKLIQSLYNVFEALYRIFKPIKTAWENVFPPMTGETLLELTDKIYSFTENLKVSENTMERIANVTHIVAVAFREIKGVIKGVASMAITLLSPGLGIVARIFGLLVDRASEVVYWFEHFIGPVSEAEQQLTGVSFSAGLLERGFKLISAALRFLIGGFRNLGNGIISTANKLGLGKYVEKFNDMTKAAKTFIASVTLSDIIQAFEAAREKVGSFFKMIENRVPFIKTFVEWINGFESPIDALVSLIKQIPNPIQSATDAFNNLRESASKGIKFVSGILFQKDVNSTNEKLVAASKWMQEILDSMSAGFTSFSDVTSKVFGFVWSILEAVIHSLVENLKIARDEFRDFGIDDFIRIMLLVRSYFTTRSLMKALNGFGAVMEELGMGIHSITDSISGFIDAGKGMLEGLTDGIKQFQKESNAKILIMIASALLILSGAVYVLSKANFEKSGMALAAFAIMLGGLIGAMALLGKMSNGDDDKKIDVTPFIAMAASLWVIVDAFSRVTSVIKANSVETLLTAAGFITSILAILTAIYYIMTRQASVATFGIRVGIGIILFVKAIGMLIDELFKIAQKMKTTEGDIRTALATFSVVMIALGAFFRIAGGFSGFGIRAGIGIWIVANTITTIFEAFKQFEAIPIGQFISKMFEITVMLVVLGAFFGLTSRLSKASGIFAIGTAFVLIGAGMLIIANALGVISKMRADEAERATKMISSIMSLILVFTGIMAITKSGFDIGEGFLGIASGMLIISLAVQRFSKVSTGDVDKATAIIGALTGIAALAGIFPSISAGFKMISDVLYKAGIGILAFVGGLVVIGALLHFAGPLLVILQAEMGTLTKALIIVGKGIVKVLVELADTVAEGVIYFLYRLLSHLNNYIIPISNELVYLVNALMEITIPKLLVAILGGLGVLLAELTNPMAEAIDNWLMNLALDWMNSGLPFLDIVGEMLYNWASDDLEHTKNHEASKSLRKLVDDYIKANREQDARIVEENKKRAGWNFDQFADDSAVKIDDSFGVISSSVTEGGKQTIDEINDISNGLSSELEATKTKIIRNADTGTLELVSVNSAYDDATESIQNAGLASEVTEDQFISLQKSFGDQGYLLQRNAKTGATEILETFGPFKPNVDATTKSVNALSNSITAARTNMSMQSPTLNALDIDTTEPSEALQQLIDGYNLSVGEIDTENPLSVLEQVGDKYNLSLGDILTNQDSQLEILGTSLGDGLKEGILNSLPGGLESAESYMESLIGQLSDTAEVHSPSKRTYAIAEMLVRGITDAFDDGRSSVFWAANQNMESAIEGTTSAFDTLSDLFNSSFNYEPSIRPVLDTSNIQEQLYWMNSQFTTPRTIRIQGDIPNFSALNGAVEIMDNRESDTISLINEIRAMRNDIMLMGEEITEMQIVLDTGAVVGATSRSLDRSIGESTLRSIRQGRR